MAMVFIQLVLLVSVAYTANGCNEVYQRLSGEISSPNYPGSYPKDASCDYFIKMDPGEQIMLKFLDLDLADPISCVDSVEIFDVNDASRGRLAKICGKREKGKLYHFHTNILRITFKSNRDIAGRGFKVSFWAKRLYPQGCSGHFKTSRGSFHSPSYPNFYPNNAMCENVIDGPAGRRVKLYIKYLMLPSYPPCGDALEIYDGRNAQSRKIATLCGSSIPTRTFISTGRQMMVRFRSDGRNENFGFKVDFEIVPPF